MGKEEYDEEIATIADQSTAEELFDDYVTIEQSGKEALNLLSVLMLNVNYKKERQ